MGVRNYEPLLRVPQSKECRYVGFYIRAPEFWKLPFGRSRPEPQPSPWRAARNASTASRAYSTKPASPVLAAAFGAGAATVVGASHSDLHRNRGRWLPTATL